MSERKTIMFNNSQIVVALPGGIGTFDELLEAMTLVQLNALQLRGIGLLNTEGFFNPFLAMCEAMVREGFLQAECVSSLCVADTPEALLDLLMARPPCKAMVQLKW